MNWQCPPADSGVTWSVTATGQTSGRTVSFDVVGKSATVAAGDFEKVGTFEVRQPDGTVAGSPVTFSYDVKNVGNAPLQAKAFAIGVKDPSGAVEYVNCSSSITLNAGATFSCSATSTCLLYTSPSPRDATLSRMPSSA